MSVLDQQIAKKYISLMSSANSRGLEFSLSLTSVKNLLNSKKCYFTGVSLNFVVGHPHQLTIDRLDADKGYVKGNVVACACYFNQKKNNLTTAEIELLYRKVVKAKLRSKQRG
jgi:hypothetical protein